MAITSQTSLQDKDLEKKVTLVSFYAKNTKTVCNPLTEPYKFDTFDDGNSSFYFPSILSDLGIKNDLIETMEKINQIERRDEKKKKILGIFSIILFPFIMLTSVLGCVNCWEAIFIRDKSDWNKFLDEEFNKKCKTKFFLKVISIHIIYKIQIIY